MGNPFRKTADGTRVFFPWGNFGPAYEMPSDSLHDEITRYRAVSTFIGLLAIAITAFAWRAHLDLAWRIGGILVVLAVFAHYVIKVRGWTKGLTMSAARIDTKAESRARLLQMNPVKLWFALILSLLFAAAGCLLLTTKAVGGGIACIGFGGSLSAVFIWVLKRRQEAKRNPLHGEVDAIT
jgi:glucan phosphoethanolaminetransferase (alkaline phosphatase superfamily)